MEHMVRTWFDALAHCHDAALQLYGVRDRMTSSWSRRSSLTTGNAPARSSWEIPLRKEISLTYEDVVEAYMRLLESDVRSRDRQHM